MAIETKTIAELMDIDPREVKALTIEELFNKIVAAASNPDLIPPEARAILDLLVIITNAMAILASIQDLMISATQIVSEVRAVIDCIAVFEWQSAIAAASEKVGEYSNLIIDGVIISISGILISYLLNQKITVVTND